MAEHYADKAKVWIRDAHKMVDKNEDPTLALQWAQTYLMLEMVEYMPNGKGGDNDLLRPLSRNPALEPEDYGL
jgi:hypothetical protein